MRVLVFVCSLSLLSAQTLPGEWSQSYCTFDCAQAHAPGSYSLGFGIDNYALYGGEPDSTAYDTRRFDIFGRVGLFKNGELEIKFSYPTSSVMSLKYLVWNNFMDIAIKCGIGYMKGTRSNYETDYVFDFYPNCLISKPIRDNVVIFYAPKIIYSIYPRDRQEHTEREPRNIFQYGHGMGIMLGNRFKVMVEANWMFGTNETVAYTVNQYGLGINAKIY